MAEANSCLFDIIMNIKTSNQIYASIKAEESFDRDARRNKKFVASRLIGIIVGHK